MTVEPVDRDCADERSADCDVHGPYLSRRFRTLNLDRWSGCEACLAERIAQREREQEAERERIRRRNLLREANLIGRFRDCTFDSFTASTSAQRQVLQACRGYVDMMATGTWSPLWLIGPPGTGKTHLGSASVRAGIESRGMAGRIVTARGLIRAIRDTWRREAEQSEQEVIAELGHVSLLVIDEIGLGFGTEAELVQLFDVIDRRYQLQLPTMFISNLAAPALRDAVGDRLYDRMREFATVQVCNWPSHRRGASEDLQVTSAR